MYSFRSLGTVLLFAALLATPLTGQSPGRALQLGDSSYAIIASPDSAFDMVPGGERTVALWLRYTQPQYHAKILSKVRPATAAEGREVVDRGWILFAHQHTGTLGAWIKPGPDPQGSTWTMRGSAGLRPIGDGRWHHVALVQRDTLFSAYVDGRLDFEFTVPRWADARAPGQSLRLGWDSLSVIHFVGEMDELTLWSRALSPRQIRQLMYHAPDLDAPGLTAYWPFDGDEDGWVRDEGLRSGAEVYLAKPFDPAVLEAQVASLLEQRRRLRARLQSGELPLPEPSTSLQSPLARDLRAAVEPHLGDPDFSPEALAAAARLSYKQLYRRLREEHDLTPSHFLRTARVERAADLLREGAGSVTEVAYSVGFNSLSYFHRAFRERFGVAPTEYLAAAR